MAKKKTNTNLEYEEIIHHRKLPLLTLDNRWHQLFSDETKTSEIKKLEQELNARLKKQGKANNDLKNLKKLKQNLMNEIVHNMDSVSDGRKEAMRQRKLERSRKIIEEINTKIEKCEEEQFELPQEIKTVNEKLMIATAECCNNRIKENEAELAELAEWIDKTRIELKKRILLKQEKEDLNEKMYSYLHDMLGPEFMEAFDIRHSNNKKEKGSVGL